MLFEECAKLCRGDFRMKTSRDPEEMKGVVGGDGGVIRGAIARAPGLMERRLMSLRASTSRCISCSEG